MTVDGFSNSTVKLFAGQVNPQFISKQADYGKVYIDSLIEHAHLNIS